jgi:hypothetical protein
MGNKKGGGMGSRSMNAPTTYFTGQPSTRINPRGVSQVGQAMGNHATDSGKILRGQPEPVRTGPVGGMGSVELGDSKALDVGGGGPGTGRVVMPCGSQSAPPAAPSIKGTDILRQFGPDSKR